MASGSSSGAMSSANLNAVRETMDVLLEISRILNTGLDMETLSICVRLCEQGINPEALSSVIKELRKATEALKHEKSSLFSVGSDESSGNIGDLCSCRMLRTIV
ncbi:mitotic-spindle organizing protein 1 isoform X1 [Nannospalax galili]|uniref:mitotic-spindle organizing protein 1 isoform X1 n=1 Tax=Nannospalax galili TaxID=1026970 RepID=UPI0004ED0277|nr:mitotic-spindle organizing protein 1 isoform X1 [Nannospalax galili]